MTPQYYNENAEELAKQYLSKSFDEVHQSWSQFLPVVIANPNARILDLGAGAGRDAKYMPNSPNKRIKPKITFKFMRLNPQHNLPI